jgi:hypothetical protein
MALLGEVQGKFDEIHCCVYTCVHVVVPYSWEYQLEILLTVGNNITAFTIGVFERVVVLKLNGPVVSPLGLLCAFRAGSTKKAG